MITFYPKKTHEFRWYGISLWLATDPDPYRQGETYITFGLAHEGNHVPNEYKTALYRSLLWDKDGIPALRVLFQGKWFAVLDSEDYKRLFKVRSEFLMDIYENKVDIPCGHSDTDTTDTATNGIYAHGDIFGWNHM